MDDIVPDREAMEHELGVQFYVGNEVGPATHYEIVRRMSEITGPTQWEPGASPNIEVKALSRRRQCEQTVDEQDGVAPSRHHSLP